jgi:hypothetical protein
MTISSSVRTAGPFAGTGANTIFPFTFKVFQTSDLLVARTDASLTQTVLALSVDYTVTLNPDQNVAPGGTVFLLSALPVGYTLNVTSNVPLIQPLSLTNLGGFFPRNIEDELDRLTILQQQLNFSAGQVLRVPEFIGVPPVPAAAARASGILGFDSLGNPLIVPGQSGTASSLALDLANSVLVAKGAGQIGFGYGLGYAAGTIGKWLNDLVTSTGAAFIGWVQTGTGAVTRLVRDKLRDEISVLDFGAVADDTTDCLAAFQACYTECVAKNKAMIIPGGTYKLSGTFTISADGFKLIPRGIVKLHFTGSGQGLVVDGGAATAINNVVVGGDTPIKLKGNALTTDICYVRAVHRSLINIDAKDGTTGLRINFSVCTRYIVSCSINTDGGFLTRPVNGIIADQRGAGEQTADCEFYPIIEGVSGTGIVMQAAEFNNIRGGTSEGNNRGLTFSSSCASNRVFGGDYEANTVSDIEDSGVCNHIFGVNLASSASTFNYILQAGASQGQLIGGYCRYASVDAAAVGTAFFGVSFSSLGITGAGSWTNINCYFTNGSLVITSKMPDQIGESGKTWTPAFSSAGGGTQGAVTQAVANYNRVGKQVFVQGFMSIAKGTLGAGAISVTGLPFGSRNTTNYYQYIPVSEFDNINLGAGYTHLALRIAPGTSTGLLVKVGSSVASATVALADFPDPMGLRFSGSYEAA